MGRRRHTPEQIITIVANPELLGVTGRVVVDAPEGVYDFGVEVFRGDRLKELVGN